MQTQGKMACMSALCASRPCAEVARVAALSPEELLRGCTQTFVEVRVESKGLDPRCRSPSSRGRYL